MSVFLKKIVIFVTYPKACCFFSQKCKEKANALPVEELMDRPLHRIFEYRSYLSDLLRFAEIAGTDTSDLKVGL